MNQTSSLKKDFLVPAPEGFKWPRCPQAEKLIDDYIEKFLHRHSFARRLSERMLTETSTRLVVWTDHVVVPAKEVTLHQLHSVGFIENKKIKHAHGTQVFWHPYADLPKIIVDKKAKGVGCAIKVDQISHFQMIHGLSLPIEGTPYSTYRRSRVTEGAHDFFVVERRGSTTLVPDQRTRAEKYLKAFEIMSTRPRNFKSEVDGMKKTLQLAKETVRLAGEGQASWIFLETERNFWQSKNLAGQIQKNRQDQLGMGWANHDHHTFRSGRAHFPMLVQILLTFGFKLRERYYAGGDAGWGAQIMEQPEAGTVIFADVDLSKDDVLIDFSRKVLPPLQKPRTVGLWCALHGESILQAGMHHLEAKFDFEQLKSDLKGKQIETMPPFSDFSFLRQAFTKAEAWRVPEIRLNTLLESGAISQEAFQTIKANGAVGSHLENLQRHEGFKGFNQKGVSDIIKAVNPEKQALKNSKATGA